LDPTSIKYYDQNASTLVPEYHSAEVTGLHTLLGRWLPAGGNVLEIGCGAGRDAAFMASLGCKVVATDASESMMTYSHEYLQRVDGSDSVSLLQAAFPLPNGHKLLSDRFDAVVSMAVLMHIPDSELFDFAYQIRTILKYRGHFICSFCTGRAVSDDDPRLFVNREAAQIQLFFERIGFRLLYAEQNKDGLGRDILWTTLVFESEGMLGIRPVDQIEAIINRDRKVATYKFALLRALCEISQTEYRNVKWHANNQVSIPLGLIAEKWLYYYWPLIESESLIPQMNGFEGKKQIAFRRQLSGLIDAFRTNGGISAFHAAFRSGKLTAEQHNFLLACIKSISDAIVKGPVTFTGGSIEGISRVFSYQGNINVKAIRIREDISTKLGDVYFDASIWRELCLVGHWIGEAILLRWAELVHEFSNQEISVAKVISLLLITPESNRDAELARSIYKNLGELTCVWSNRSLNGSRFDVDHIIPFALWHNNDLWNLVPSDQKVNNRKRDKIITRDTLYQCEDRIIHYWRIQNDTYPERFQSEVSRTLLGRQMPRNNWEKPTISALAEAVELVAIQRGVERWENQSFR
jgi:SAM-dependent methyltransferase